MPNLVLDSKLAKRLRRFHRVAFWFVVSLIILLALGGLVRVTGSGMGCPDWPKCFGQYVPPTKVGDLPAVANRVTYHEMYAQRGYQLQDFPLMTWIEYINRLWAAVLVGPLSIILLILGFRIRRVSLLYPLMCVFAIFLIGFEAWLGKIVVEKHLDNYNVTIHLLPAFLILALAVAVYVWSRPAHQLPFSPSTSRLKVWSWISFVLLLGQIISGTFVRTELDLIASAAGYQGRDSWIALATNHFPSHRLTALIVVAVCLPILLALRSRSQRSSGGRVVFYGVALGLFLQFLSGTLLYFVGFPAAMQLLHLLASIVLFASVAYLIFALHPPSIKFAHSNPAISPSW